MKILQVNNVYAEKSTGKITKELHEGLLRAGHESLVVYGRGKGETGPGVIRLCPDWYGRANSLMSRFTGLRYGGCLLSTWHLQRIILREKPDVVHLQCINGNFVNIYRLISWLKDQEIKTVVSLHAEFMYTANCGHAFDCDRWIHGCGKCPDRKKAVKSIFFDRTACSWRKMRKAFSGFEKDCMIVPVSPWTQARAKQSGILKDFSFRTIYNGVNTSVFYEKKESVLKPVVLNVTAHFSDEEYHPKGGWYLIRLAEKMPEVEFLVAGNADWNQQLPKNLQLLGEIRNQEELAELYRWAAVSIIVSKRETFSMPCAESLCCGTPVVGFEAGAPEQIALPEYSAFVRFGDLDGLENVLRHWLGEKNMPPRMIAKAAAERYSVDTMVCKFIDVYRSML